MTDYAIDERRNLVKLATSENRSYTFSFITGEIINVDKYRKREYRKIKNSAKRKKIQSAGSGLPEPAIEALLV